jgi:hypothetical protein
MKHLLTLLLLSPLAFAEEIDTTIVCVLDGKSDEYIDRQSSRAVKVTQTIQFTPSMVTSFKQDFLSDYDFLEASIWQHGFANNKLEIKPTINNNEIKILLVQKDNNYQHSSNNVFIQWVQYELLVNRKSGIGKVDASLAYTIYDTPLFPAEPSIEEIKASKSTFYNLSYSAYGECTKGKNKF